MKLNHKIDIDLKEFILKGKFDFVVLGQTQEWLWHNFADPDDRSDMGNKIDLWRFSSIEFYFLEKELFQIYCDNFLQIQKSKSLNIQPWVFKKYKKMTLSKFLKILNKGQANYSVKHDSSLNNAIVKISKSQMIVYFSPEYDAKNVKPHQFLISAFCLNRERTFEHNF